MNLTLLLDLDDTLLINPMQKFIPAYLQALSQYMSVQGEPQRIIEKLLSATEFMSQNKRPDRTLKEAFDSKFYPALGWEQEKVNPIIEQFYAEVFPALQKLTQPRAGAIKLVNEALSRGYRVGIATNPLFPVTAINQRLAWAGIPPEIPPLKLISSYETFHFTKPNPAYYAEFLARIGWPDGPVLMVGDDPINDISPACQLGLATFWAPLSNQASYYADDHRETHRGDLQDVMPWIDALLPGALKPILDQPGAIVAILQSTPAALDTLCNRLEPGSWNQRPESDEWCQTEILCHLRDVDQEVNLPRLYKVIHEENPFIPGKDTDPWAEQRQYKNQDGIQALHKFTLNRIELIDLLTSLSPQDWERRARHAIFGPTSLRELANIIAAHDRLHIQQLNSLQGSLLA